MFQSVQTRSGRTTPVIDIAPLIDIVFILLVFFLVTARLSPESVVPIRRPTAVKRELRTSEFIRANVAPSGDIYVNGNRLTLSAFRAHVRREASSASSSVVLISDRDLSAGKLISIMDAARLAGARDVTVAVAGAGDSP